MAAIPDAAWPRLPGDREAGVRIERSWAMFHLLRLPRPTDAPDWMILGGTVVSLFFIFVAQTVPLSEKPAAWLAFALSVATGIGGLWLKYLERKDERERRRELDEKDAEAAEERAALMRDARAEVARMYDVARDEIARMEKEARSRLAKVEAEAADKRHKFADRTTAALAGQMEQILDQGELVRSLQAEVERLKTRLAIHEPPPSVTVTVIPQGNPPGHEEHP